MNCIIDYHILKEQKQMANKRIIVFYSLSGNTKDAVEAIAGKTESDVLQIDTVKAMPKSFFARILVGGGQVAMKYLPKLKSFENDLSAYDEIIIGTPIWNGKCVPAIRSFIQDETIAKKIAGVIVTSGSGNVTKCMKELEEKLPDLQYHVSLVDKKNADSKANEEQILRFAERLKA